MSDQIPIIAAASQTFSITLGGQRCRMTISQKSTGVYMDLWLNDVLILAGMICLDRVRIVRHSYLGFVGNLIFLDTMGTTDPDYTGFGSRYILVYES